MSAPSTRGARPGRPALAADRRLDAPVNVRMSAPAYDAAYRRATAERRSLPELVRRAVSRYLAEPDDDDGE